MSVHAARALKSQQDADAVAVIVLTIAATLISFYDLFILAFSSST